ncbi:MAG TPA: hypothetical protein VMY88_06360 [Acidimicrobiales bacterium]|nr:hypothetical protein [Acidimicrobiales bacterium]
MSKNYIAEVASAIQAQVPSSLHPDRDADLLFLLYAVLALSRGVETTGEDVHDAWAAWMTASDQEHEALVPFARLDDRVKQEDEPYVHAIRTVAASRVTSA